MQRGYIKVYRKLLDSSLMRNPLCCVVFVHLLLRAAYQPCTVLANSRAVKLAPGQLVTGRRLLARELDLSEYTIRSCLVALQEAGIITVKPRSTCSLITIVNWNRYQSRTPQPEDEDLTPKIVGAEARPDFRQQTAHPDSPDSSTIPPQNEDAPPVFRRQTASKPATLKERKNIYTKKTPDTAQGSARGVPAGALVPAPEFVQVRALYDTHARTEGPLSGHAEYRRSVRAGVWPGADCIIEAILRLAGSDEAWQRGYAPGLGRFITERQWLKQAPPPRAAPPPGALRDGDVVIAQNLEAVANVLARRQARGAA